MPIRCASTRSSGAMPTSAARGRGSATISTCRCRANPATQAFLAALAVGAPPHRGLRAGRAGRRARARCLRGRSVRRAVRHDAGLCAHRRGDRRTRPADGHRPGGRLSLRRARRQPHGIPDRLRRSQPALAARSDLCTGPCRQNGANWSDQSISGRRSRTVNAAPGKLEESAIPFDHGRVDRLMDEAGHRCAARDLQAQHAVSARRLQVHLLRRHGCDRPQPLPADRRLREGPAGQCRLYRQPHGRRRARRTIRSGRRLCTPRCWGTLDAANLAVEHLQARSARQDARIGIEPGFLPSDAYAADPQGAAGREAGRRDRPCWSACARSRRRPSCDKLRIASELITDSMLATIAWAREGTTKTEIIEQLRREETNRGLHFEYCLLTLGSSHNRAASPQAWKKGEVLSIDSGGNYPRLYRRSLPHGRAGRAGRRAARTCWPRSRRCSRRRSRRCAPARSAAT